MFRCNVKIKGGLIAVLLYLRNLSIRHLLQVFRFQFKDRVGSPCRRPDGLILQEIFIEIRFDPFDMTDGRHASDREACNCSREIGICLAYAFSCIFADAFFVHAVRAAGEDEDRLVRLLAFEDQRLHNLTEFASRAVCGFLRRARGLGVFDHAVVESERGQQVLNFLSGGGESGHMDQI